MSPDIVDLCLEYSKIYDFPIMIIASRNQVDVDGGYVFKTRDLIRHIKKNNNYDSNRVLICRDHCGPFFSDKDSSDSLNNSINRCFNTLKDDILAGFDLIHIDVSRVEINEQEKVANLLFDYAIHWNSNLFFEFGSEDNTGENLDQSLSRLKNQLELVEKYKRNIKFFVTQTGSYVKHDQIGSFDIKTNSIIANILHSNNLLFKEHNADYLSLDDVRLRKQAGVDALNIAPQLGAIQSKLIYEFSNKLDSFKPFFDYVLNKEYWKKWVTNSSLDDKIKFIVSAHYFYNSDLGKDLLDKFHENDEFKDSLRQRLFNELNNYRLGYENN